MKAIKNVTIGDKFTKRGDKRKDVYTVIDIYTVTDSSGEVVRHECMATHDFLGQTIKGEIPFATVVMGRIDN